MGAGAAASKEKGEVVTELIDNVDWTKDDTEQYLSANPLPPDFRWRGRIVAPQHRTLKKGYGFWLRTTPYHPGLFEEVHRILVRVDPLPSADELARQLSEGEKATKTEDFF